MLDVTVQDLLLLSSMMVSASSSSVMRLLSMLNRNLLLMLLRHLLRRRRCKLLGLPTKLLRLLVVRLPGKLLVLLRMPWNTG